MNQLQRIILINSGNIDFQELKLDGNIHFIGTQGTGKSTLLRAILFFYNADTRKLGISKEKKSFSEYYFPYADSYIIYEVKQDKRRFCVWLYKKQNRLCFRFIDGPYEQDIILHNQQALSESEVIAKVTKKGYKVNRPIYNFTDYRDIIYGANKSMRRYSIIQNQSYHNIPRTISNIFLNSSLDGGFIKKTIINSLSDEAFEINLDKNRRHLETARLNYQDVSEYLKHEKKAQNIVEAYTVLLKQEEEQKELAWMIGASFNKAKEMARFNKEEKDRVSEALLAQKQKIKKIEADHVDKKRLVQDKLSNVKRDIGKANELVKMYVDKNIEQLLKEQSKEKQYIAELSQVKAQLDVLKAGSSEVESQYQLNKQKLETECQQNVLDIEKSEQSKIDDLAREQNETQKLYYEDKEMVVASYQAKVTEQEQAHQKMSDTIKLLDFEIKGISHKHFYHNEIENLKQQQQDLNLNKQQYENKLNEATLQKRAITNEGEQNRKVLELELEQKSKELNHQKELHEDRIKKLHDDIDSLAGSLLEFLEKNKMDWQNTIGKVVTKELLLRNDLKPLLEGGDNLYGLSVQLNGIKPLQLSKAELEKELSKCQKHLNNCLNELRNLHEQTQVEKDKIQKKYNKKLAELNEEIKHFNHQAEQASIGIEKNMLAQKHLNEKNEQEKQQAVKEKEEEKHMAHKQLGELESFITSLKNEKERAVDELTKRYANKEKGFVRQKKILSKGIEKQVEDLNASYELKLVQLLKQRNDMLADKGADVKHINVLESSVEQINIKLTVIKEHYKLIVRYEKDCEDYIHRLSDFRLTRKTLEKDIDHMQYLQDKRLSSESSVEKDLQIRVDSLNRLSIELSAQINKYKRFSEGSLFEKFRSFLEHHNAEDFWKCDELIEKITNIALEYEKHDKSFTERIAEFSGYFSQQNHLGFVTNLNNRSHYRAFAENLKKFVHSQKIIDYKTEVTKKYAMVLENIVAETKDLLQNEKEVHKIIQRINSDFKNSNFVGVVRSIEMRLQESTNKIIQLLRKIQLFEAENAMSFGEINLFNQSGSKKNDDEAVKLLESLLTQIGLAKTSKLSLEDAFDLEFRICENENDTNWVSRLANVGSNGTDVLVKSMIYINLLHIFKNSGKKQSTDTTLHCLIDEVGILHDSNVTGLITFAGERNIRLINGSPNSHNEQDYKHIYMFRKNKANNKTGITKLISNEL